MKKPNQSELDRMAEEYSALYDDAIDFCTEMRGMVCGASLLERPTDSKANFALIMALAMLQVETVLNTMQDENGQPMEPRKLRSFLKSVIDTVVQVPEDDNVIGFGQIKRKPEERS